eukprot:15358020-Ditylum_brightwellii.AAC.1
MYKNSFSSSSCPQKGYAVTYNDFYHYGLDSNSKDCMEGTINVQNGDNYVAKQLWETISNLIDEFIHYLPHTFIYQNVHGNNAIEEENKSSDSDADDTDDTDDTDDDKAT